MTPRIMGRVGQIIEGPHKDKWIGHIFMTSIGAGVPDEPDFVTPVADTKEKAQFYLRDMIRIMVETIQKQVDGVATGQVIDMKTNELRTMKEEN